MRWERLPRSSPVRPRRFHLRAGGRSVHILPLTTLASMGGRGDREGVRWFEYRLERGLRYALLKPCLPDVRSAEDFQAGRWPGSEGRMATRWTIKAVAGCEEEDAIRAGCRG